MKGHALLLVMLLLPVNAAAQQASPNDLRASSPVPQGGSTRGSLGVRGGVFSEEGDYYGPLAGAEGWFLSRSGRFAFNPNLELAVADNFIFTISSDFALVLTPESKAQLWVGAGVGLIHRTGFLREDQTDVAGNLLFGLGKGGDGVRPYVQVKAMLSRETHMSFVFGVRF